MSSYDRDYYRPRGFGGFSFFPPMIKYLIIINVVVFFLQQVIGSLNIGGVPGEYLINRYLALNPIGVDGFNFQIWQLVTYQFLHGGIMHIFFNMFALWIFGVELEYLWGSQKFIFYYLLCGIGAGLLHLIGSPIFEGINAVTIGASGSVYGVLIAFGMLFPDRYIFLLFPPIPIKAKYLVVFYIVIEFMSVGQGGYVAHLAHLGGAAVGALFVLYNRRHNVNIAGMFRKIKNMFSSSKSSGSMGGFRQQKRTRFDKGDVEDADFYEINSSRKPGEEVTQEEIDRILDKISESGYQNLTEREKKILFEASKRN